MCAICEKTQTSQWRGVKAHVTSCVLCGDSMHVCLFKKQSQWVHGYFWFVS